MLLVGCRANIYVVFCHKVSSGMRMQRISTKDRQMSGHGFGMKQRKQTGCGYVSNNSADKYPPLSP